MLVTDLCRVLSIAGMKASEMAEESYSQYVLHQICNLFIILFAFFNCLTGR